MSKIERQEPVNSTDGWARRVLIKGMAATCLASKLPRGIIAQPMETPSRELIRDPHFQRGAQILNPKDGQTVVEAKICPFPSVCNPVWNIAQWYSHFDLAGIAPSQIAPGIVRYANPGKQIIFGTPGSSFADLTLAVNGRKEFNDVAPSYPFAWPHLYVQQALLHASPLSALAEASLALDFCLLKADIHRGPTWSDSIHTAQFQLMLNVQNANQASRGYRDYLWFIVPMYDARYLFPQKMEMKDIGNPHKLATGRFIFSPGGEVFTRSPVIVGVWGQIRSDLVAILDRALQAAWEKGFLKGSQNIADYQLSTVTIGWEVPGTVDASMQIRNLSLSTRLRG